MQQFRMCRESARNDFLENLGTQIGMVYMKEKPLLQPQILSFLSISSHLLAEAPNGWLLHKLMSRRYRGPKSSFLNKINTYNLTFRRLSERVLDIFIVFRIVPGELWKC